MRCGVTLSPADAREENRERRGGGGKGTVEKEVRGEKKKKSRGYNATLVCFRSLSIAIFPVSGKGRVIPARILQCMHASTWYAFYNMCSPQDEYSHARYGMQPVDGTAVWTDECGSTTGRGGRRRRDSNV